MVGGDSGGGDRSSGTAPADSAVAMASILQCSHCKRIFSESSGWQAPPDGFDGLNDLSVTHGICPDCLKRHFPEFS